MRLRQYSSELDLHDFYIELLRVGSYEDDELKVLKPVFCCCCCCFFGGGGQQLEPGMSHQVYELGVLSVCQYHSELIDSSG